MDSLFQGLTEYEHPTSSKIQEKLAKAKALIQDKKGGPVQIKREGFEDVWDMADQIEMEANQIKNSVDLSRPLNTKLIKAKANISTRLPSTKPSVPVTSSTSKALQNTS